MDVFFGCSDLGRAGDEGIAALKLGGTRAEGCLVTRPPLRELLRAFFRSAFMTAVGAVIGSLLGFGCMGPIDDGSELLAEVPLPAADAVIPSAYENRSLALQIAAHDGIEPGPDGVVPRVGAFVHGKLVRYWPMGTAPDTIAPMFVLAQRAPSGELTAADGYPPIIDTVPGAPGYTPFWRVTWVPVTAAWQGERLTSLEQVERAMEEGLVEAPIASEWVSNCVVVAEGVRLDVGAGAAPLAPSDLYWRGARIGAFAFEPWITVPVEEDHIPVADVYALRREGQAPLHEGIRQQDLTGDGDTLDTNCIFAVGLDDDAYTPLWTVVDLVVPVSYRSIDDSGDEAIAEWTHRDDLLHPEGSPIIGRVIAFKPQPDLVNCPIQLEAGGY